MEININKRGKKATVETMMALVRAQVLTTTPVPAPPSKNWWETDAMQERAEERAAADRQFAADYKNYIYNRL